MKVIWSLFFFMLVAFAAFAQKEDGRYSEQQISEESKFVDAAQLQLLGKFEEALVQYEKILKDKEQDDSQTEVIFFQMSRCYETLKDYPNSIKYGQMAYEMNSSNEFYLRQLAEAYEGNNEIEKSGDLFFDFTSKMPQEAFFYEKAVFAYLEVKAFDKAIRTLDVMEKKLGVSEDITRQKFEIYSKSDNSKQAVKELQKLVKAFPNQTRFALNLANYYLQLGEISKAKSVYKDVLEIDPENETAQRFMQVSSNPASNELKYIRAASVDVSNPKVSIESKLSKLLPVLETFVQNPTEEVARELSTIADLLIQAHPQAAQAYAFKGDVMFHRGETSAAIKAYKNTLNIDGAVFDVWYQLMVAQRQLELYTELRNTSDQALLRFPNQGIAYLFHGHALNQLDDPERAFDVLQEAMIFVGKNNQLRANLKVEMAYSRFLQESYDLALKILDSEPLDIAEAYELRGDILFKQSKVEEAVAEWNKAAAMEPSDAKLQDKISRKQL